MSFVAINSAGLFARTIEVPTHGGRRLDIKWVELNHAELFREKSLGKNLKYPAHENDVVAWLPAKEIRSVSLVGENEIK